MIARLLARTIIKGRPLLSVACAVGALTLGLLLLYEGTRPGTKMPLAVGFAHLDKVLHFSAHLILATLLLWAGLLFPGGRPKARLCYAAAGAFALDCGVGLGAEAVQYWLGQRYGRQADWGDVAANIAGALAATFLFLMVVRWALTAYINHRRTRPESY